MLDERADLARAIDYPTGCLINNFTFVQDLLADLTIKSKVDYAAVCKIIRLHCREIQASVIELEACISAYKILP
jgi:hypothetical protein